MAWSTPGAALLATTGALRNPVQRFPFDDVELAYSRLAAGTLESPRALIVL